jgi:hypothetical protein
LRLKRAVFRAKLGRVQARSSDEAT